jgi:hypothetical protein
MTNTERPASLLAIAAAWLIVVIPLSWGVYQSVVKSLPLFHSPALKPAAASPPK